ncbi:hypothetical protein Syun_007230 [Stephania yunnanensis]|uniref:Myb-like domain-containing protein n=1 Tax=Stephania yunnanensis TaxID=152371 RepID=A0AAP0L1L6_9MAGN
MFNGGPHEQFHQFMASRAALPLPLPVTLPFHVPPNTNFTTDHIPQNELQPNSYHHHHQLFQYQLVHRPSAAGEVDDGKDEEISGGNGGGGGGGSELEGVPGTVVSSCDEEMVDPWSKEEVFALLAIRSSLGNNDFSDFIWGLVSRKLAELGFKRSAEKCKEKIEEVIKYNNHNTSYDSNYCRRSFNELDALFEDPNHKPLNDQITVRSNIEVKMNLNLEETSGNETLENPVVEDLQQQVEKKPRRSKKRKRNHKLELLKGFSEFVSKVMIQQEQLHKRLLEDMKRREEERIAREESWRKKEMDRLNKEIEIRAREQAIAIDREATIVEFLKKFTSSNTTSSSETPVLSLLLQNDKEKMIIKTTTESEKAQERPISSTPEHENPNPLNIITPSKTSQPTNKNPNSAPIVVPKTQNKNSTITNTPSSSQPLKTPKNPNCELNTSERDDLGKRWPREEVDSLIKLRCSLYSTEREDKGLSTNKAPLWERISQGMLELGYKRSAKKCKEKWENINKYFRKTKDANKKRSVDSKTCPYFHQLSSLYNCQGRQLGPDHNSSSEIFLETSEGQVVQSSSVVGFDEAIARVDDDDDDDDQRERSKAQVSPLEFEY